jgi:sugar O-acyltransferase (sialic acid O-acetyltransferase NeuD family)
VRKSIWWASFPPIETGGDLSVDDVVIYGAGGLGCLVQDILLQRATNRPVAFLDSNPAKHGQIVMGLLVRGGTERIERLRDEGVTGVIVAIGDSVTRVALAETLATRGLRLISAIHPSASIAPSAALGEHLIIGARVTICVHARIGAHSVLSAGSIAEHDNQVGRGVFLGPAVRLAGTVTVEDFATLGIGASVIPGRRVGRGARVHPGAVVIHDVPRAATVGGIPATSTGGQYQLKSRTAMQITLSGPGSIWPAFPAPHAVAVGPDNR